MDRDLILCVVRHGEAEPFATRDALRPLTRAGMKQVSETAGKLSALCPNVDCLIASPYLRAQQSADLLEKVLRVKSRDVANELTPDFSCQQTVRFLYEKCQCLPFRSLLVVSHLPLVDTLLHNLCGIDYGRYSFATGSAAVMTMDVVASGMATLKKLIHSPLSS